MEALRRLQGEKLADSPINGAFNAAFFRGHPQSYLTQTQQSSQVAPPVKRLPMGRPEAQRLPRPPRRSQKPDQKHRRPDRRHPAHKQRYTHQEKPERILQSLRRPPLGDERRPHGDRRRPQRRPDESRENPRPSRGTPRHAPGRRIQGAVQVADRRLHIAANPHWGKAEHPRTKGAHPEPRPQIRAGKDHRGPGT